MDGQTVAGSDRLDNIQVQHSHSGNIMMWQQVPEPVNQGDLAMEWHWTTLHLISGQQLLNCGARELQAYCMWKTELSEAAASSLRPRNCIAQQFSVIHVPCQFQLKYH